MVLINVIICETLMLHCCFIDDSLMTLWRNIYETVKILMQTLKIINVFNVLFCETSMFHWWFVDESSMKHWWFRWKHWRSLMITKSVIPKRRCVMSLMIHVSLSFISQIEQKFCIRPTFKSFKVSGIREKIGGDWKVIVLPPEKESTFFYFNFSECPIFSKPGASNWFEILAEILPLWKHFSTEAVTQRKNNGFHTKKRHSNSVLPQK